jgi:hypothetical protein
MRGGGGHDESLRGLSTAAVFIFASVLGLLMAAADVACPFGDDPAQFCISQWHSSSGLLASSDPPAVG